MAIVAIVNTASTYTACAVVPNSQGHFAQIGFTATAGGSGCVIFLTGSGLDGSPLMPIVAASGGQTYMSPLFNPALGNIVVASVSGGSAIVWLKAAS